MLHASLSASWTEMELRFLTQESSPGVGFLAGQELLDVYETAIVSTTFSVLVS